MDFKDLDADRGVSGAREREAVLRRRHRSHLRGYQPINRELSSVLHAVAMSVFQKKLVYENTLVHECEHTRLRVCFLKDASVHYEPASKFITKRSS